MTEYTTPTLTCYIDAGLNFDYLILTIKGNNKKIEKTINFEDVEQIEIEGETLGVFYVTLTQEETGYFEGKNLEAQINIINGDQRLASYIVALNITKNLHDEVIE